MRSEPQDIGLPFDVLTPKLPCLTRFSNIIFETSVVKRVNSDQVSLVHGDMYRCMIVHVPIWQFRLKIEISERSEQFETDISFEPLTMTLDCQV